MRATLGQGAGARDNHHTMPASKLHHMAFAQGGREQGVELFSLIIAQDHRTVEGKLRTSRQCARGRAAAESHVILQMLIRS